VLLVVRLFHPTPDGNPNVTAQNFHRLKYHMSRKEVEAIFGGPGTEEWTYSFGFDMSWEGQDADVYLVFGDGTLFEGRLYRHDTKKVEHFDFGEREAKERRERRTTATAR
jgi:hypothetical protein